MKGDYTMKKTLPDHEYAQAYVIIDDDGISLISYTTLVCNIDADGFLTCTGTYSRTTIKHIGWFMRAYGHGLTYYDAKRCYLDDVGINVYTGEVKTLKELAGIA